MKAAFDGTFCMWPSNDINQDTLADLTTLGVVDLDTSILPDGWIGLFINKVFKRQIVLLSPPSPLTATFV